MHRGGGGGALTSIDPSLFTSDAMAGTLDVYFINKDILSFQLLASASVVASLGSFDIVRAVFCLL